MARNIKASLLILLTSLVGFPAMSLAYVDQIAIEMPNAAKSIYDVRVHSFLRHLVEEKVVIDTTTDEWLSSQYEEERQSFLEQFLAQVYVKENELRFSVENRDQEQVRAKIEAAFPNQKQRSEAFAKLTIDEKETDEWIQSYLILQRFKNDYIGNRVVVTEQRIQDHYQTYRETRFLGKPLEQIVSDVREDLSRTLLREEFQKWVSQEIRRKKMILKSFLKPAE